MEVVFLQDNPIDSRRPYAENLSCVPAAFQIGAGRNNNNDTVLTIVIIDSIFSELILQGFVFEKQQGWGHHLLPNLSITFVTNFDDNYVFQPFTECKSQ